MMTNFGFGPFVLLFLKIVEVEVENVFLRKWFVYKDSSKVDLIIGPAKSVPK